VATRIGVTGYQANTKKHDNARWTVWRTLVNARSHAYQHSKFHQNGSASLWALTGLVAFSALTWFCVVRHVPALEQAWLNDVQTAIAAENTESVVVGVNGYNAHLTGTVPATSDIERVLSAAKSVNSIRNVTHDLEVLPVAALQVAQTENASENSSEPTTATTIAANCTRIKYQH